ncbi:MAG: hypothetical protein ACRDYD_13170, partial [Acidimicrobiales bacterium]
MARASLPSWVGVGAPEVVGGAAVVGGAPAVVAGGVVGAGARLAAPDGPGVAVGGNELRGGEVRGGAVVDVDRPLLAGDREVFARGEAALVVVVLRA